FMDSAIYTDELFDRHNFSAGERFSGEYFSCTFRGCDFSNCDLSEAIFSNCCFHNCNWSMVGLNGTRLQDISFEDCKLVGVDFSVCSNFALSLSFERCNLHLASFWDKKLPKTDFKRCECRETNFTGCVLTGSDFTGANLLQAIFEHTHLERAN